MKFFLELQISQQNPSVSLRLPAPFSREPNLIYKIIKMIDLQYKCNTKKE